MASADASEAGGGNPPATPARGQTGPTSGSEAPVAPVRVLVLEDRPADAELMLHELRRGGLQVEAQVVASEPDFLARLGAGVDVVLADHALPQFDARRALRHLQALGQDIPFIVVSGTVSEEEAVEYVREGAADYLLKDRLGRLSQAVVRALNERHLRLQHRQLEEQVRRAQRLEAIGRLAGGVAHDFNNLITLIAGFSELLQTRLDPADPLREYVDEIARAAARAAGLTRQLLAFSRRQVLSPAVLDLNRVVAEIRPMLRHLIRENIALALELAPDLGRVKADPAQLEQVLVNLVVNARDAMPHGGRLTIATTNADLGESPLRQRLGLPPGPYVTLVVSDTGVGMDATTLAHLFEPFFTTKPPGQGTGLGLATVYGIVQQSGGAIDVASAPGQGAHFAIYLPRVAEVVEGEGVAAPGTEPPRGTETVLVVEDDAAVRGLMRRALEAQGYTVLEAAEASAALALSARHPGPIHLVVADVVLPGPSGPQTVERLRAGRPGLPALYVSGHGDEALAAHSAGGPDRPLLRKPFTPEALARMVRQVLDTSRPSHDDG